MILAFLHRHFVIQEVKHLLKSMQPHREKPSKDRSKRFYAGKIHGDQGIPHDHDVLLYQYWALNPQNASMCRAKCFVVGQIISIFHLGKMRDSEKKVNKNLQVTLDLFTFNADANKYIRNGRSGLLKAHSILLLNISEGVTVEENAIIFDHNNFPELLEYVPYHEDVDVEARQSNSSAGSDEIPISDDSNDPFIVEKILDKRFHKHRNQYEYLVQWIGYTDKTLELPNNIPDHCIQEYENTVTANRKESGAPYSLRQCRKLIEKRLH